MESALTGTVTKLAKMRAAPLILELDLTDGLLEARPAELLSAVLTRRQNSLAEIVSGLKQARSDDRVKALIVKVGGRPIGLGMVQELRGAVEQFRAAGKVTVAWADTFGEFGWQCALLPGDRVRDDLPAAIRRPRPDRTRGRAGLPARRA